MRVERLVDEPIISANLHASIGLNIQGPSMIRVPDWIEGRLGDYYLYFADHKGRYIRPAYASDLLGPWRIHPPGRLQLEESSFLTEPPKVTADQCVNIPLTCRFPAVAGHQLEGFGYSRRSRSPADARLAAAPRGASP